MVRLAECYNIDDLRVAACKRLPRLLFEFVDRGAEDEVAPRNNREAIERIKLAPRALVDVKTRSQKIRLFGVEQQSPIYISPTGVAGLLWHDGEIALARAAAAAGIPFSLATTSVNSLEEVAEKAGGTLWYQLYVFQDREQSFTMVDRAEAAGYQALVLTVDSVVAAKREYNYRNGYTTTFSFNRRNVVDVLMHPRWLVGTLGRYVVNGGMPEFANYPEELRRKITSRAIDRLSLNNQSLTWNDLRALRKRWQRKLIIKGIMHPQDAALALDCGVDAIVVSNHGGRNFDCTIASVEALPRIVDIVRGRAVVMVDGGFRRGQDVVKALALGANAVGLGRATLYGVATAGEPGAGRALDFLRDEIDRTLAYLGCTDISQVKADHLDAVTPRPETGFADLSASALSGGMR